ncbi:YicC/YloC family endoribonuclease [Ketobacter sp.]|uniref:YicC/YloC family endoribonuclease n=1 Tax=Ketobacter sp. TaxID=2083498 RepID=UPI000F2D0060|nr:YicC/YloC family endoribonuclease [Ketobacter sp.]MEE2733634.1 YicC/YloC family endoribonuclease [Pseudomonadota bacterium]RLT96907.1 MAG: YicC family protein [Ketobacter sp.]
MIRSMTAFSRKEHTAPWGTLSWELRSVNHRYLEVHPRLPDTLRDLENPVREALRHSLSRGKVECTLKLKSEHVTPVSLEINETFVKQLLEAAHKLGNLTGESGTLSVTSLLNWPGVVATPETDQSEIQQAALSLLKEALKEFIANREREGQVLNTIIGERLDGIDQQVAIVRQHLPEILQAQKEKLKARLEEISANVDQDRLEQEIVYLAQKTDVDEELDRLETHVKEVRRTLKQGGAVGRRLDFLMQELNREANTLGSKSINTLTTQAAVELKVLIEQMREQIQNIE